MLVDWGRVAGGGIMVYGWELDVRSGIFMMEVAAEGFWENRGE